MLSHRLIRLRRTLAYVQADGRDSGYEAKMKHYDGRLFVVAPDTNTWIMMTLATCGTQVVFVILGGLWILLH